MSNLCMFPGIRYNCNRYSRNKIYRKTVLIDRNIVFMKMMCYCNTLNRDIITANTDELTFTEKHSSCLLVVIGFFFKFFFKDLRHFVLLNLQSCLKILKYYIYRVQTILTLHRLNSYLSIGVRIFKCGC